MPPENNTRPVCLITGGTSGIGLATARLFADQGYDVSICGRRETKLAEAQKIIGDTNDQVDCFAQQVDLADTESAKQFALQSIERFGRIDVLINNAALSPLLPFDEISPETFESVINVNIRSLFHITQTVWKQMKEQGGGTIVNISSLSAVDPFPGFSLYGACKAWMDLLTHSLGGEGKELGIRICSIRPGAVETPMLRGLFPDYPADQCVQPEDIAEVAMNCVKNPDSFNSGEAFSVTRDPIE